MMAGNPNWWSVDTSLHNPQPQFVFGSPMSNPSPADDHRYLHLNGHEFPARSWSQLLMSGSGNSNEEAENWEDQLSSSLKQEENSQLIYGQYSLDVDDDNEFVRPNKLVSDSPWRHHHHHNRPVSSPTSCITTLNNNNNILSFSNHNQDHLSECNSTGTGGAAKKARVSQCSPQPAALKVRKEKLGDRITTLHNLVSPFGKTDTASVLSEAIGYIRFLQAQIEALSTPYMRNAPAAANKIPQQNSERVQESNSLFPDETDQDYQNQSGEKDLRRMGLCLVPTSCTQSIENESEADYWAPAAFNFSWRQG